MNIKKMVQSLLSLGVVIYAGFVIGCGSSNSGVKSTTKAGYPVCPGQISTQYGCLNQGNCGANQGWYQPLNQCVSGNLASTPVNYYGANSCIGGQVYTMYNCQPTAGCSGAYSGYGYYQGQCYPPLTINNGVPNTLNSYYGGYTGYSTGLYNTAVTPYSYYYYPNINYRYYQNYNYPSMGAYFNLNLSF